MTGYTRDEVIGKNPRLLQSASRCGVLHSLWERLLATGHWYGDIWDRRKDGSIYPKYLDQCRARRSWQCHALFGNLLRHFPERKTVEERLDRLAHYDVLTGSPNRSLLMDRLEQLAERLIVTVGASACCTSTSTISRK
ncbi:MAG: hypothetical protein U1E85_08660 [Rhodocyclaceae bacterium]